MNTVRLNITVPKDLARKLSSIANKSALITQALKEKIAEKEKAKKLLKLKEAYKQVSCEETQLNRDWEATLSEGL